MRGTAWVLLALTALTGCRSAPVPAAYQRLSGGDRAALLVPDQPAVTKAAAPPTSAASPVEKAFVSPQLDPTWLRPDFSAPAPAPDPAAETADTPPASPAVAGPLPAPPRLPGFLPEPAPLAADPDVLTDEAGRAVELGRP
jgi:hypothetical protein